METFDDIFEEEAKMVSAERIEVTKDSIIRHFRNYVEIRVPEHSYDPLFGLIQRGISIMPNVIFLMGHKIELITTYIHTDVFSAAKVIMTYTIKNGNDRAINSDVHTKTSIYIGYDFCPFTFSSYCHFFEFLNNVAMKFSLRIWTNDYNSFVNVDYRKDYFDYLNYKKFQDYYYGNELKTFESLSSNMQKYFKNILSDNYKNYIERQIVEKFHILGNSSNTFNVRIKGLKTEDISIKFNRFKNFNINGLIIHSLPIELFEDYVFYKFDEYSIINIDRAEKTGKVSIEYNTKIIHSSLFYTDMNLYMAFQIEETIDANRVWCIWCAVRIVIDNSLMSLLKFKTILMAMFYEEAGRKIYQYIKPQLDKIFPNNC